MTTTRTLFGLALLSGGLHALDTPTSYGEAASVDTPILRIPMMAKSPVIDGVMQEGEWEDASALSGFWYDYSQAHFLFLAPMQTQLQVYLAYDKENLYLSYTSPVYPESSWMKARGRLPDVLGHPLMGLQWDDHVEFEFRPVEDNVAGFQYGLFRYYVNPIGTILDYNWTPDNGDRYKWNAGMKARSQVDAKRWVVEMAIPLASFLEGKYAEKNEDGSPRVVLPPPDGTAYRSWFVRGIGGNGAFFNAFDKHVWNTTKTKIIFDSQAPSIQINELGPVMEDTIDVHITVKNHSQRSETVRLGFFVESPEGTIYSSYDAPELDDGQVSLRPGEVRKIRLVQPIPGIATDGNILWFDMRSAGTPAKSLFRTRLIRFHSMEGGSIQRGEHAHDRQSFMERRVEIISQLRPPREDFRLTTHFSDLTKRMSCVIDKGIHGASDEAKRAVEARFSVTTTGLDEDVLGETTLSFIGDFACGILDLPDLVPGEEYQAHVLLFDADKRIVGERSFGTRDKASKSERLAETFVHQRPEWMGNTLGLDDEVWEPFTAIQADAQGFTTLRHRFTIAENGLPAQIAITADERELPLEERSPRGKASPETLKALSRGNQLRSPFRFEAIIDGKRVPATVVEAAKPVREWKSERDYAAVLSAGPLRIQLTTRYDCDGSLHAELTYSGNGERLDGLEMLADFTGSFDLVASAIRGGSMAGSDIWNCTLPQGTGVVWDSNRVDPPELFYSRFVPFVFFGNADRGFTWFCDSDKGWILDKDSPTMSLERGDEGLLTWRVRFINHPATVAGERRIDFSLLTHPAKFKPKDIRTTNWHHMGIIATGYQGEPYDVPEESLLKQWRFAAGAPADTPDDQRETFRKDQGIWGRYGFWRNVQMGCPELDQEFEDKATWYFERKIRIGRRVGGWMDEYWPTYRSMNLASGKAYLRDPETISENELPWQDEFHTTTMRRFYKRMARLHQINNVPNRNCTWANNASTMLESFLWDAMLVEECGAGHRSYDVDCVTQFPLSLYRYISKPYTGLAVHLEADSSPAQAGDDRRYERQWLGLALLHDIGASFSGPHGAHAHPNNALRLLDRLDRFGFFDDQAVQVLPYWRNGQVLTWGALEDQVVTAYRRTRPDGAGEQAVIVLFNRAAKTATHPLVVKDPVRLLGAAPTLTMAQARMRLGVDGRLDLDGGQAEGGGDQTLAEWWKSVNADAKDDLAIIDLETGEALPAGAGGYGPISVGAHDFRIFYIESRR